MEKARAEYQKSKYLDAAEVREERLVGLTSEIDTANVIKVGGTQTVLDHGGRYLPLGEMPRLERALYPYCTGSTWRGADHRRLAKERPAEPPPWPSSCGCKGGGPPGHG